MEDKLFKLKAHVKGLKILYKREERGKKKRAFDYALKENSRLDFQGSDSSS